VGVALGVMKLKYIQIYQDNEGVSIN